MIYLEEIIYYIIAINVFAVILTLADKIRAANNKWRISEKMLFSVSFFGGALGMYTAMKLIRHKTKHKRFMIGLPLIIIFQLILVIVFCKIYS